MRLSPIVRAIVLTLFQRPSSLILTPLLPHRKNAASKTSV